MVNIKELSVKFFTNNESLRIYLNDIRKYKVLTNEEEIQAFNDYRNGDMKARERILNSNQRFVFSMAKRYAKNEDEVLDYVNEGNIGLATALEAFSVEKGFKFITFAVWYIQRSMNYYLTVANNLIKQSNSTKIGKKADSIRDRALVTTGEPLSDEEVIAILKDDFNIVIKEKTDILHLNIESINEEVSDDFTVEENTEYNNATATYNDYETKVEKEILIEKINSILKELTEKAPRAATIIKMFYGVGYDYSLSVEEISEELDICPEDVQKTLTMVLKYLQQEYKGKLVG